MAAGVKAGEAFVEILASTTKFEKGLRRAEKGLKMFSKNALRIGAQLTGIFAALAAPLAISSKNFSDFEASLAKVGTLLDDDAGQIKQFSKEIKALSAEFGESTDTLASGLFDIISAGTDSSKAIGVLRAALVLAKAGFTDTAISADALTTVLNAYNKDASQAASVSDDLFTIAKLGKTDFAKLAPNIGKVATLASSAGVSFEELGAAISTITRAGISTEETVTSIAAIISTFLKPSKEGAEAAAALGVDLSAAGLAANGFFKTFKKLEGIDTEVLAKIFPNVRAVKGILPILKNIDSFSGDIKQLSTNAGAVEKAFSRISGILSIVFGKLKAIGAIIALEIGEALAADLKRFADILSGVGEGIAKFISENRQLVRSFASITVLIGATGAALIGLGVAGAGAGFVFGGLATILKGAVAVLSLIPAALAIIVTKTGLVTAAVVALGAIVVNQFNLIEKSIEFLKGLFSGLAESVSMAFDGIKSAVAAGDLSKAWEITVKTMELVWAQLVGQMLVLWEGFKAGIINTLSPIVEVIVSAFVIAFGAIQFAWESFTSFFVLAWQNAVGGVKRIINGLTAVIEIAAAAFNSAFGDGDFSKDFDLIIERRLAEDEKIRNETIDQLVGTSGKTGDNLANIIEETLAGVSAVAERGRLTREGAASSVNAQVSKAERDVSKLKNELDEILNRTEESGIVAALSPAIRRRDKINNRLPDTPITPGAVTARGGFNPFGIGRQSDLSFQREMLKNAKNTADNTKKLVRNQENDQGGKFQ